MTAMLFYSLEGVWSLRKMTKGIENELLDSFSNLISFSSSLCVSNILLNRDGCK